MWVGLLVWRCRDRQVVNAGKAARLRRRADLARNILRYLDCSFSAASKQTVNNHLVVGREPIRSWGYLNLLLKRELRSYQSEF